MAGAAYDPEARDEVLERYLADATGGDADFAAYLQRAAGYTLTGDVSEEVFFLVLGQAMTGKTTLAEMLLSMMGSYGLKASFETFLEASRVNPGGARPDLAKLRGARLVAAVETAKTRALAEPLIKELVGGDTVTVRNLYQKEFSFKPTCKVWLAANHSPRISDDDSAIWRRLRRVPFEHIPEKPDPQVKKHLTTDPGALAAALAWAVQGCLIWQDTRLGACDRVQDSTAALRAEMDPLTVFLASRCVLEPGAEVVALELRQAYEQWARENGAKLIGNVDWGRRLRAHGCQDRRERRGKEPATIWHGIGLLDLDETKQEAIPF